jgi:hypothetical protein
MLLGRNPHIIHEPLLCVVKAVPATRIKGKAIPLQAWTSPEVSRRLRLPDFKTLKI